MLHLASGDSWGGAERVISLLLDDSQTEHGIRTEALLLNEGRLASTLRASGVAVTVVPEQRTTNWKLLRKVRAHVQGNRCDVVHAHRYKEILLGLFATILSPAGLVVTVHGLERRRQMGTWRAAVAWGSLVLARMVGARFVSVSPELERRVGRIVGRGSIATIGNPAPDVDPDSLIPARVREVAGWSPDRRVVGFVGRLEYVKGPDILIDIAARTPARIAFVLIGSGSLEGSIRDAIEAHGLEERVRLIGEVPDAMPYVNELDALALTSRHEGTPMIVLESARCAVPVVAFDVGGVSAMMRDAPPQWLVTPLDVDAFASRLVEVLDSSTETRAQVAEWSRSLGARYARTSILASYRAVYSACTRAVSS
ncbi:MAG: glycosyltransferase [Gemmatimonadota bacterium]